ncbi:hypothetical protein BGZ58_001117 [Dissophora ornata]|nr:hypothetical protein BGZ58_001117 [Dissophora ornata]
MTSHLLIFCLVDGKSTANAFSVKAPSTATVDDIKELIKAKKAPAFDGIELTLWRVSIPVTSARKHELLTLDTLHSKEELLPTTHLNTLFPEDPFEDTIHIMIQRPPSDIETATLDDLKGVLVKEYPQYECDHHMAIYAYHGQPEPKHICHDHELRMILKLCKMSEPKFKNRLKLSLGTPSKSLADWTFKDVCAEYNLSEASDPDFATTIFDEDLYLASQRNLSGRRGNGPVDFSVHSHKTQAWTLAVTMVKGEDFRRGVAQNMVQLESALMESALMEKKRKRETYDVDGVEQPPKEIKSYGIVTDASEWAVIECTIDEDEAVSYRMTKLPETLAFAGNWQQGASDVFQKLLWLWSEMLDESIRA